VINQQGQLLHYLFCYSLVFKKKVVLIHILVDGDIIGFEIIYLGFAEKLFIATEWLNVNNPQ